MEYSKNIYGCPHTFGYGVNTKKKSLYLPCYFFPPASYPLIWWSTPLTSQLYPNYTTPINWWGHQLAHTSSETRKARQPHLAELLLMLGNATHMEESTIYPTLSNSSFSRCHLSSEVHQSLFHPHTPQHDAATPTLHMLRMVFFRLKASLFFPLHT